MKSEGLSEKGEGCRGVRVRVEGVRGRCHLCLPLSVVAAAALCVSCSVCYVFSDVPAVMTHGASEQSNNVSAGHTHGMILP